MRRHWYLGLALIAVVAGMTRFQYLGRSALRADELNRYLEGRSPVSLVAYWRDWQPTNQMPLQNVLAMGVARLFPEVNEFSLRFPGAVLGVLTVLILAGWTGRRWGPAPGLLAGLWLALNPYHLYESREAYYYGLLMFAATLFSLYTLEWIVCLRAERRALSIRAALLWTASAWLLCLSHMSAWMYALVWGLALLLAGIPGLPRAQRRAHFCRLALSGLALLFLMRRWIRDAIGEVSKVGADPEYVYFGDSFANVAPRVLPMFLAGYNAVGFALLGLTIPAALFLAWRWRATATDSRYVWLTGLTLVSVGALYAYVGLIGGGVAKETFFSACWPVLLVWAPVTLWKAARALLPGQAPRWTLVAAAALALILARPAWFIMRLDGKPTPYHQIQAWLDRELPPGTVVVVDRWFEPWVEMAIYAPTNVVVTFTVPDEPYRQFREGDWRGVTQRAFEQGTAQAFLRLTRNHEEQAGPWDFPARFFARQAEIANPEALWLRRTGYAVMSGLYAPNTNRVVAHVFHNTDADWAQRARAAGRDTLLLFDVGWGHLKPWRPPPGWPPELVQTLWLQAGALLERGHGFDDLRALGQLPRPEAQRYLEQGQWADYRIAGPHARWRAYNLTDRERTTQLHLTAIALSGPVRARLDDQTLSFPPQLMVTRQVPVTLRPGRQEIALAVPPNQFLLVLRATLQP
ncbi:MAG: hypothetical protein K9N49_05715 [Candidatus Marinimicrobia bacterium]|nr:hypothetical protein [Candidatus Neomarinimicrobiota bacterium]